MFTSLLDQYLFRFILSLSQAFLNSTALKKLVATWNRTQDHLLNLSTNSFIIDTCVYTFNDNNR